MAQKQLHGFPFASWADDMKLIQLCLDTLEFCGTIDPIALRFHVRLSRIYSNLDRYSPTQPNAAQRTEDWVSLPPDFPPFSTAAKVEELGMMGPHSVEYLLTIPPDPDPQLLNMSMSLLLALCKPWDEPASKGSKDQVRDELECEGGSRDSARLDWSLDNSLPFSWDTTGLGLKTASIKMNRFLGSEGPSGWLAAPDLDVDADDEIA